MDQVKIRYLSYISYFNLVHILRHIRTPRSTFYDILRHSTAHGLGDCRNFDDPTGRFWIFTFCFISVTRIETELCRFGGLKFWSPYVCPIWVRPAFQAAKATQLRVNSKLFAQKSRGATPNLGYPFCRLLVESCDDPPKKAVI